MSEIAVREFGSAAARKAAMIEAVIEREAARHEGGPPPRQIAWRGPSCFRADEAALIEGAHHRPEEMGRLQLLASERVLESLPWNLTTAWTPWGSKARDRAIAARRLEGFFRAVVLEPRKHRFLLEALEATSSRRGINSPRTLIMWDELAYAWDYSPGAVERALRRVMRSAISRAQALRQSGVWVPMVRIHHVAWALFLKRSNSGTPLANRRTHRAATIAVAYAIGLTNTWTCDELGLRNDVGKYRKMRAALERYVRLCRRGRWVKRHGVWTLRTSRVHRVHRDGVDVLVYRALTRGGHARRWHTSEPLVDKVYAVVTPDRHHFHMPNSPHTSLRRAIDDAIHAQIMRQVIDLEVNDVKAAVLRIEEQRDMCLLVRFEDSLAAGNCAVGTREWVRRHMPQHESRGFAPAVSVLAAARHSAEAKLALRAVVAAIMRVKGDA